MKQREQFSPKTDAQVVFVGDKYVVSFNVPRCACDSYTIAVQLGGEDIPGSPFVASLLPGLESNVSRREENGFV